ncbi:type II secretion system F family protein [Desulfitobacterium hafniense]|uniref:type II secretion system F family protein n=1 Tax=Desulfitobacterium hafniense TaxID=49338 RepID=UPI00036C85A8|nr:hypothetical protein [Desulfitobacterium hafniense]
MNLPMIAAFSLSAFTFIYLGISEEDIRRNEVFGVDNKKVKHQVMAWIEKKTSYGLRSRLLRLGISPQTYITQSILMTFGAAVFFGLAGRSLAWALFGGGAAYLIHWMKHYQAYTSWHEEVVAQAGNLATLLKIRLIVGDTVSQAIPAILPILHGPMKVAWMELNSAIAGGISIPDALDRLADKIGDRDMSAILMKLKTYHREGVPTDHLGNPDPFGDMAAKIERSAAKRVKYATKKMSGSLTLIAGVGFFTFVLWLIPYFYRMLTESLGSI